jgi:SAM-dependent methyltransferase
MREISCPICSRDEKRTVLFGARLPADVGEAAPPPPYSGHYQINQCVGCGLIFSSPIMDDRGVAALYEKSSEANVQPGEEDNVRRTMAHYYRLAAPHLAGRMRMLDIGCDMGFLLEAARADGFAEVYGIEPVPVARRVAQAIPGARISEHFFETTTYPCDYFDLITLIHVLDHLDDPRVVLKKAMDNLRPGGLMVAVVHNIESLLYRVLGERFPIFNFYHHYFFSKRTLGELFRRQGFEVVKVVSTKNCYSLGFFAQRMPGVPDPMRQLTYRTLRSVGLAQVSLMIPIGNIGIIVRRPTVG